MITNYRFQPVHRKPQNNFKKNDRSDHFPNPNKNGEQDHMYRGELS